MSLKQKTGSLLIYGAKQIVCISNSGELYKTGNGMRNLAILSKEDEGLSIGIDGNGIIRKVGKDSEVANTDQWERKMDATDMCIIPGFVDAHTHSVWAGDRVHEFAMKLEGATYLDIHKAGGGIHFTVEKTKEASEEELLESLLERLSTMATFGTTYVECKSGYGLELESEIKMLTVIEKAKKLNPLEISSTFCGAHAVPRNNTAKNTATIVAHQHIPTIKNLVLEGKLSVDNVDVFCEKGVFELAETEEILKSAKNHGFQINFHSEELNHLGGASMGASLQAEAISHLEEVTDEDIHAMAKSGSVAVLLPTTAHLLKLTPPPARKLIDSGVAVCLGTDFNPNAYCMSMPYVMHIACILMRLTMNEALVAATLNAAHSLRKSDKFGSIEVNKQADLVLIKANRWEHIIYQIGCERNIIAAVIKKGQIIYSKN